MLGSSSFVEATDQSFYLIIEAMYAIKQGAVQNWSVSQHWTPRVLIAIVLYGFFFFLASYNATPTAGITNRRI